MFKQRSMYVIGLMLAAALFISSGCSPTTTGAVRDDSSRTGRIFSLTLAYIYKDISAELS